MANKYRVEHDGLVFTRTSRSRTYTHVVLRPTSLAKALQDAEDGARHDWKHNHAYHSGYLPENWDATLAAMPEWRRPYQIADKERSQARALEWLAKGEQGLIDEARARVEANWRRWYPCGRVTGWVSIGWAGRLDLAQKLAKPGNVIVPATLA